MKVWSMNMIALLVDSETKTSHCLLQRNLSGFNLIGLNPPADIVVFRIDYFYRPLFRIGR